MQARTRADDNDMVSIAKQEHEYVCVCACRPLDLSLCLSLGLSQPPSRPLSVTRNGGSHLQRNLHHLQVRYRGLCNRKRKESEGSHSISTTSTSNATSNTNTTSTSNTASNTTKAQMHQCTNAQALTCCSEGPENPVEITKGNKLDRKNPRLNANVASNKRHNMVVLKSAGQLNLIQEAALKTQHYNEYTEEEVCVRACVCACVCLSVCLSVSLSLCLSVSLSLCVCTPLSTHPHCMRP